MKKTPLYNSHIALGAKMSPFAGFEMPLQYGGIIKEHGAARGGAAVFDTCHMGEFRVCGGAAVRDLERVLSCDVADLRVGACRYGFMCNAGGGVMDDLIIYRMAESEFMLVVNAGTADGDFEWLAANVTGGTSLENISEKTGKIDINGPAAPKIVASMMSGPVTGLKYYGFAKNSCRGGEVIVSRTGYTGEIGFEIYCGADTVMDLWDDCIGRGAVPAGLGARDVLRLEMGYPLYGHELTAERCAAQAGFPRAVSRKKEFIGSDRVLDPAAAGQTLAGIALDGRRAARHGDALASQDGKTVGVVTSGSFSPALGFAVALAYVDNVFSDIGTELRVISGKTEIPGKICELPFYKNATARSDINLYL
ncbi:MAG: glycine cleavage system aminomethyltransferase GcvT [Chitinispirillia bacterium]|nr:glycine cleavage system aminomethyltransferase GcvT [Chitinispirillia bacterium]MCL2268135.1 glycine cleavage system aminomethyltransferase GcvT [Chitinispirillia bacterium]